MSHQPDSRDLNFLIVMMTQAMIGLVSPTLVGVAMDVEDSRIRIYFAVLSESAEQKEDIDEIVSDFEAFLYPNVPEIEVHIDEGYPTTEWRGSRARQVFRAKA